MIKIKKIMSLVLALVMSASLFTNGLISAFATETISGGDVVVKTTAPTETLASCEECGRSDAHTETCSLNLIDTYVKSEESIVLDFLPTGLVADSESMTGTTAVITANPVTLYKSLDNGAEGIEVAVESGTVIDLITKYTFTTDTGSLVFYRYDYDGTNEELNSAALSEHSGYVFVYFGDISIQSKDSSGDSGSADTTVETEKTDTETGVILSAELPKDVTLDVAAKTVEESGLDTTTYPISGACLFYDVTLLQNNAEYQPENGVTVTFPESAITASGLVVGDYYKVYHIHDSVVDMSKPAVYNGGDISIDFENLSVVGVAQTSDPIDLITQHGTYTEEPVSDLKLAINKDSVTLYDSFENSVHTAEVSGVSGIEMEAFLKVTFEDGFVLYQYFYYGSDAEFTEFAQTYQFISAEDVTEASAVLERTLTDEDYTGPTVTVSGKFESGVELSVEIVTLDDVATVDPTLAGIPDQYIGMDISLLRNGTEYQPTESVTVTMNVGNVASTGEDVLVYHVHENEDGTVTPEILGPFKADSNGCITFAMSRFSYLLVFNGTANHTITDVETFYPVVRAPSGNGHYQFLGIYYDANDDLHFLLATCDKTPTEAESKFVSFYIDGKQYIVSTMGDNVQKVEVQTYNVLQFKDATTGTVLESVTITENKGIAKGFYDVNVGKQQVAKDFGFAISQDSQMPSGSQAWNINGMVEVKLEYQLIKTVAAGTSATATFDDSVTVERGDWVIFKINVDNFGDMSLNDMLVQDILPAGVFDMSTVQMSIDGENGQIGNWQAFNSTLFSDYDSAGHFSRLLYIKAQVDPNLTFENTTDKVFVNKATIGGMNMPTYEDTATVIVKAPTTGALTVSKAVTSENPKDTAPVINFIFTIHSDAENAGPFIYTKSDGTNGTVDNNGTFTLKNGESIEFSGFPVGNFTVAETEVAGFTTKINGEPITAESGKIIYSDEMKGDGAPVVAFENQFSTRMATLIITKKVEKDYINDVPEIPDEGFEFTVVFGDGTDTTPEYPYTIGETTGTIKSGGTIKLSDGQTAVISNIPVGTDYTVTENLGNLSDDYKTSVNGTDGATASRTIQLDSNTVNVVNTYKQHFTDLTITKSGAQTNLDENQSFIFDVVGPNGFKITVTINGNGSVTIKNVPFGEYTVTENTDWSWRYTPTDNSKTITLEANGENKVTFANNRSWIYWLSGDSYCENWWGNNGNVIRKDDEE